MVSMFVKIVGDVVRGGREGPPATAVPMGAPGMGEGVYDEEASTAMRPVLERGASTVGAARRTGGTERGC